MIAGDFATRGGNLTGPAYRGHTAMGSPFGRHPKVLEIGAGEGRYDRLGMVPMGRVAKSGIGGTNPTPRVCGGWMGKSPLARRDVVRGPAVAPVAAGCVPL